jgi:hypothetical protein
MLLKLLPKPSKVNEQQWMQRFESSRNSRGEQKRCRAY